MTHDETRVWITTTITRFPGLADFFAKAPKEDVPKIQADWAAAVENVQPEAASRFMHAMIAGEAEVPQWLNDWSKLPAMLRRWARENKPIETRQGPVSWADPQSFRCLACQDRGYGVEVFNPLWVRSNEIAIENGLDGLWWAAAKRWCREKGFGPFTFACDCGECDRGRKLFESRKVKRLVYQKDRFCIVPGGGVDYWPDALAEWVAEHPMMEQAVWQPTMDYGDIVGDETY